MTDPAATGRAGTAPEPEAALRELGARIRAEDTLLSECVVEPREPPALGLLVAAGPRAAADPGAYATLFETIREGALLHYAVGRVVRPLDDDLALLAGDELYARGLEQVAGLGDLEAVAELADLISLTAQLHASGQPDPDTVAALWLAAATAVGHGPGPGLEEAKEAAREGRPDAASRLWEAASARAADGARTRLARAAESIGFTPPGAA